MSSKYGWRARGVTATLVVVLARAGSEAAGADLCQGLSLDKAPHPMTPIARPARGAAVVDPEFGGAIRRITEVPEAGANPVIAPLYSTVSAWNADESRLLLYHVGRGHELYDGRSYRFIRALDIDPVEPEQVYWHVSDPDVLFYPTGRRLVRYHLRQGIKETVREFTFCATGVTGGADPMFMSWDSGEIGLKCGDQAFIYRLHDDTVTGRVTTSLPAPQVAPSGTLAITGGYVVDAAFRAIRRLDLANPYEHASLGRLSNGDDAYHAAAYDPGPSGAGSAP